MKKTIIPGLMLLSSAILFSCKKEGMDITSQVQPSAVTTNRTAASSGTTASTDNPVINFIDGYISASSLTLFNLDENLFDKQELSSYSLFAPVIKTFSYLKPGDYSELVLKAALANENGQYPLYLKGNITDGKMTAAIVFYIQKPMKIRTSPTYVKVSEQTNLLDLMHVSLEKLVNGLPTENLERQLAGGQSTIIISSESNPDLFDIMMHNLSTMMIISY
jgi:hypothetical protein